ncbi:hypothetical protein DF3PB_3370007 [uncultured Defluviicoccus sp.]|uniref:Uncharacterized protein n=1 Tax=metagenome TaxID=256318 RepID=A0A380TFB4_9ZZZZ|nr:hypothetical protein DF3PB_3370007 [uncultured Defluviicoccus sp.]
MENACAFHPTHFCCGLVACARKLLIFADTVVARGTPGSISPSQIYGCYAGLGGSLVAKVEPGRTTTHTRSRVPTC